MDPNNQSGKELGPEGYKLKQQNIQLRYSLRYKDEVEIPNLKRQGEQIRMEMKMLQFQLHENAKQEEFLDGQVGIIQLDLENRIVKINQQALEVLGLIQPQAIGRNIEEVGLQPDTGKPIFGDINYHLEPDGRETEWEKEISLPNGEKRYYQLRSRLIDGTRLIAIFERTALRISESRVKAIIGSSKDGILVVDEAQTIQFTNSRFGKLFDINWRQFNGMKFGIAADLLQFHFKDSASFHAFYTEAMAHPENAWEQLFEMVLPQTANYQFFTRPINDEKGRIIGRVWFVTDVTHFKEMEKELRAQALHLEDMVQARTQELTERNEELKASRDLAENRKEELESELDMAKQVQEGLLPRHLPQVPGYQLDATYVPTGKVGGDFYDITLLDSNRLFLLMADVSGHGVPAALVTAMAKMSFDRHMKSHDSVSEILTHVNQDLCYAVETDHYLTAFCGILEIDTGKLSYSRVCHPYPTIYRAEDKSLEQMKMRGGFFLGMFEENNFSEEEVYLNPGDLLFVYTDGINESFNQKDEQYGRDRLNAVVKSYAPRGARDVIAQAQLDKERFAEGRPSLDDITIFAVARQK